MFNLFFVQCFLLTSFQLTCAAHALRAVRGQLEACFVLCGSCRRHFCLRRGNLCLVLVGSLLGGLHFTNRGLLARGHLLGCLRLESRCLLALCFSRRCSLGLFLLLRVVGSELGLCLVGLGSEGLLLLFSEGGVLLLGVARGGDLAHVRRVGVLLRDGLLGGGVEFLI